MVEAYAFAGTTMTVLMPGAASGGAFTVLHVIKPNGCSTPPHSHEAEVEIPYVLAGTLGVETEGRRASVSAGECVTLPPARPHRLFNDSRLVGLRLGAYWGSNSMLIHIFPGTRAWPISKAGSRSLRAISPPLRRSKRH